MSNRKKGLTIGDRSDERNSSSRRRVVNEANASCIQDNRSFDDRRGRVRLHREGAGAFNEHRSAKSLKKINKSTLFNGMRSKASLVVHNARFGMTVLYTGKHI